MRRISRDLNLFWSEETASDLEIRDKRRKEGAFTSYFESLSLWAAQAEWLINS